MEIESQLQVSSNSSPLKEGTSFFKTCFNGLNTLAGIGMLSMPYAISQGGWISFMLLIIFSMICWYTAILLGRCMNQQPLIKSYVDIAHVAFGYKGRAFIATFLYLELFLILVELLILEGDNLAKLFPNMSFTMIGLKIESKSAFVLITALIVLPTTWLRSLGALAYISFGGIVTSFILIGCILWIGEVDGVGFHERGKLVNLGASTFIYGTIGILGYMMYGDNLKSQITLNLPTNTISTKIAIYTTVISPFTKYAIVITPISNAIEEKWHLCKRRPISILIRTTIVVSSVIVALFVPLFGYIMAFIGAFLSVAISLLFPCLCYLKMHNAARRFGLELIIIVAILVIGTFIGIQGTYISLVQIVNSIK